MTGTKPQGYNQRARLGRGDAGGFLHECLSCLKRNFGEGGGGGGALRGNASKGPHRGWLQRWGRCAYTVELAKPADPEGTERVARRGEAELQGAA